MKVIGFGIVNLKRMMAAPWFVPVGWSRLLRILLREKDVSFQLGYDAQHGNVGKEKSWNTVRTA